jgi:hypothetical protein
MSRTTRNVITGSNYGEARKGRDWEALAASGAVIHPYRQRNGGMVMSSRSCGSWDDEYATGSGRKAEKRAVKKRERREALRDAMDW